MAEAFNILIQADKSGADDALNELEKSLNAGKETAEALSQVLSGDVSGAIKSVTELASTLGMTFNLAFNPAEIIAFVQAAVDAGQKLSTFIADTYIYTDAQKAEDKAIKDSNDSLVAAQAHVKALGREMQIAAEQTQAGKEKLKLKFKLEDLGGTPAELKARRDKLNGDIAKLQQEVDKGPVRAEDNGSDPYSAMGNDADAEARIAEDKKQIKEWEAERTDIVAKMIQSNAEIAASDQATGKAQAEQAKATAQTQAAQTKAVSEAEISATLKKNEALLGLERANWENIKGVTQAGASANETVETNFENQSFQIHNKALNDRLALAKKENNPALITALNGEIEALATQHQTALTRIQTQGEAARKAELDKQIADAIADAQKQVQAELAASNQKIAAIAKEIEAEISGAQSAEQAQEATLARELAEHKITKQQEIRAVADAKEKELQQELDYLQEIQSLYDRGTEKWSEVQIKISKIQAEQTKVREKATTDEITAAEQQWQKLTSGLQSMFSSFTQGILTGHQTIAQSWTKMVDNISSKFIEGLQRQLMEMIMQAAIKDSVDEAYYAKSSLRAAYDAAHKAFDWATQYVGPVLAMPIATAAFVAAESLGSAEGGQYYVPNNQLTMLHPQEMVLPAGIANQMRGVISGGGNGSGGTTVIVNHSVNAVDAASFQQHIRTHSNMIANEVTRALKRKRA